MLNNPLHTLRIYDEIYAWKRCSTIVLVVTWLIIVRVILVFLSICHKIWNSHPTQFIDTQNLRVTQTRFVYITRCSFMNNLSSYTFWSRFRYFSFTLHKLSCIFAPAGFWPRGQNPRRHHCSPRVNRRSTYSMNIQSILPDEISRWLKWDCK